MRSRTRFFEVGPLRILSRLDPLLRLTFITGTFVSCRTDSKPTLGRMSSLDSLSTYMDHNTPAGKHSTPRHSRLLRLTRLTGFPVSQGNLPRNALRGFGAAQWDFAVHREFPVHESLKLQFRAEMFNVLNHPNFGPPVGNLGGPGRSTPSSASQSRCWGGVLLEAILGRALSTRSISSGALGPFSLG